MEETTLKNSSDLAKWLAIRSAYWHRSFTELDEAAKHAVTVTLIRRINASLKNNTPFAELVETINETLQTRDHSLNGQRKTANGSKPKWGKEARTFDQAEIDNIVGVIRREVAAGRGWKGIADALGVSPATVRNWEKGPLPIIRETYEECLATRPRKVTIPQELIDRAISPKPSNNITSNQEKAAEVPNPANRLTKKAKTNSTVDGIDTSTETVLVSGNMVSLRKIAVGDGWLYLTFTGDYFALGAREHQLLEQIRDRIAEYQQN